MARSHSENRVVRRRFPGLPASAFVSPTDEAALRRIQQLPGLPPLMRRFNEIALDRFAYLQNAATSVRCGPRQFRTLYGILRDACEILDVPEPELYVQTNPIVTALTAGVGSPFIVLHSELIDTFTNDEILFVIGHELGHIKCEHVLYHMVGRVLIPLVQSLGQFSMGLGQVIGIPVIAAFYEWMRQAEFSCDRAGLLACQDSRIAMTAIMKLGGGGTRLDNELSVDAFMEQARQRVETPQTEKIAEVLLFLLYEWQLIHPQVVYRARDLDDWIRSGAYERVLGGTYVPQAERSTTSDQRATTNDQRPTTNDRTSTPGRCPRCGAKIDARLTFCVNCGAEQPR
jgi:Zn-dependent protease with chaperone function